MNTTWPEVEPASSAAQMSLQRLRTTIAVATGLSVSGRSMDFTGLDELAGVLCAQVLDLYPSDSSALRPALIAINQSINSLIETLIVTRQ